VTHLTEYVFHVSRVLPWRKFPTPADVCHLDFFEQIDATPLHAAVNKPMVARFLIEKNASVSAVTTDGWTPLHSAARWGEASTVEALIEAEADPNAKDNVRSQYFGMLLVVLGLHFHRLSK
jgi:ankyrin repeat protein